MNITYIDKPQPGKASCSMQAGNPPAILSRVTKQILISLALASAAMVPCQSFAAGPAPVNLGSTADFAILSYSAITSTGGGVITGNAGVSPAAGSFIGLNASQMFGTIYAVDSTGPAGSVVAPALLTTAMGDLTGAYNDAAGRTPIPTGSFLNPGAAYLSGYNIGGMTLGPGLYKFGSGQTAFLESDVTLSGGPNDVWIFQCGADLQVANNVHVILAGGAQAANIFWQVDTAAVVGTTSTFEGTIMAGTAITMNTSSTVHGRALAETAAVVFDGNNISLPSPWDAATDMGGGWKNSSWFGTFNVSYYPWIYHKQHGWMYVYGSDSSSIWLWTSDMGFLWTGSGVYPWLWSNTQQTWLYYSVGSSNPRYFYNWKSQKWVAVNP
jgi:hypothetical protein